MGYYIDPMVQSKEKWLQERGMLLTKGLCKRVFKMQIIEQLPVVLMDNVHFTAAGIAWCEKEFDEFTYVNDTRKKTFYLVGIDDLCDVNHSVRRQLEEEYGKQFDGKRITRSGF